MSNHSTLKVLDGGRQSQCPRTDISCNWKFSRSVPVIIVDQSSLVRAGLVYLFEGSGFRVVQSSSSMEEFNRNVFNRRKCLVVIGLDKGVGPILPEVASLKTEHEGLRVILLIEHLGPEEWFAALNAGVDACLSRSEIASDHLLKSIEMILTGYVVISQRFTQTKTTASWIPFFAQTASDLDYPVNDAETDKIDTQLRGQDERISERYLAASLWEPDIRLTDRETIILSHLTQGASNKHIARELEIAEATVKVHVKSLLRKIRAKNRTQAAMWAMNNQRSQRPSATDRAPGNDVGARDCSGSPAGPGSTPASTPMRCP